MPRLLAVTVLLLTLLIGCSKPYEVTVVEQYIRALQSQDYERAVNYVTVFSPEQLRSLIEYEKLDDGRLNPNTPRWHSAGFMECPELY